MQLTPNDLNYLCNIASEAALKAGKLISEKKGTNLNIDKKPGRDSIAAQVVTEVDIASQEIILEILEPTLNKYDLALLSEEIEDDKSRFEKDYFWCIDPLDGTLPFIESSPGFSVNIALVSKEGISQIGVLYDPVEEALYQAIRNQGVKRNYEPWLETSGKSNIFTLMLDRSFEKSELSDIAIKEIRKIVKKLGYTDIDITTHGGGAMNAIWVMENNPACYVKFPKPQKGGGSLWDFATTACITKEYGTWVSDIFGQALELNRKDSTFLNHKGVLYTSDKIIAKEIIELFDRIS